MKMSVNSRKIIDEAAHLVFAAALCWIILGGPLLAGEPEQRQFRMGFTPFPYDMTLEAVVQTRQFLKDHGDIVAFHIEGVPWAECLEGKPFSPDLLGDWQGQRQAIAKDGQVYLAISPGRGTLKEGEKSLPIPAQLRDRPYDDPLVKQTYLTYCRRMLDLFRPDYLAIGIEVNEIRQAGPEPWRAYAELHRHVYRALKKDHPHLPIFASFTLHGMLNQEGPKRTQMLGAFLEILPENDLVAVSFYPFIRGGTIDIEGCLRWLDENFERHRKPYAFVETGEAAERLQFPKSGQVIAGSAENQAAFYEALFRFAHRHETRFLICFLHRDYDALWDKIKDHSPEAFVAWRDCGLLDEAGHPRPAYDLWEHQRLLPVAPASRRSTDSR